MKFKIKRELLAKWMSIIDKVFVFTGQFHEMFQCVRFCFKDGILLLETFDNISCIRICDIEYASDEEIDGSFLFPARHLSKLVNIHRGSDIEFSVTEQKIVVKAGTTYRFARVDDSSYPDLDSYLNEESFNLQKLGNTEFVEVMDKMIPFVTTEMIKPELSGVAVGNQLYVSVFESVLGVIHHRCEKIFEEVTLYPYFIRMLKNISGDLFLGQGKSDVCLKGKNFIYTCRLPQASFPHGSLIKVVQGFSSCSYSVKIKSSIFFNTLKRVLLFKEDREDQLCMTFGQKDIRFSFKSKKSSSLSEEVISVEESNIEQPLEVFFRGDVWDSCQKLFSDSDEYLRFSIDSNRKPIFIRQDKSAFMFFLMPMREIST